jgi:hypothetical protein
MVSQAASECAWLPFAMLAGSAPSASTVVHGHSDVSKAEDRLDLPSTKTIAAINCFIHFLRYLYRLIHATKRARTHLLPWLHHFCLATSAGRYSPYCQWNNSKSYNREQENGKQGGVACLAVFFITHCEAFTTVGSLQGMQRRTARMPKYTEGFPFRSNFGRRAALLGLS